MISNVPSSRSAPYITLSGNPLIAVRTTALLVVVDELALERRPDVQLATVADDTALAVVALVADEYADGDLPEFDLHIPMSFT